MQPHKITIGFRFARPMFRLSTWSGAVIDDILSRGEKSGRDLFEFVDSAPDKAVYRLRGKSRQLLITQQDVQYSADAIGSEEELSQKNELKTFADLLAVANRNLHMRGVRRIGIVCEYLVDAQSPSTLLLEKVSRFPARGHAAKFHMQFEQRFPITLKTGVPNVKDDDFWNVIQTLYDGTLDADHADEESIFAMLDVQRYYTPLLDEKFDSALNAVFDRYVKEEQEFFSRVVSLGLKNA